MDADLPIHRDPQPADPSAAAEIRIRAAAAELTAAVEAHCLCDRRRARALAELESALWWALSSGTELSSPSPSLGSEGEGEDAAEFPRRLRELGAGERVLIGPGGAVPPPALTRKALRDV